MREDTIQTAIAAQLSRLQLTPADVAKVEAYWDNASQREGRQAAVNTLTLQLNAQRTRLDRLTDLLVDGTIDADAFQARKKRLSLEIAQTEEQLRTLEQNDEFGGNRTKFLELMKTLILLYGSAADLEKRRIVENTFSNRTVIGKNVCLESQNWLTDLKNLGGVPAGDPDRYTDRIIKTWPKILEPNREDGSIS